ncbi:MAG: hypothetical protein WAV23_01140 [Minisyncoccia bacterium]
MKEKILSGKIIGLFFMEKHQNWSDLISTTAREAGAEVIIFSDEKDMEHKLWETTSKTRPNVIFLDRDIRKVAVQRYISETKIPTVFVSFKSVFSPTVINDNIMLLDSLEELLCGKNKEKV